MADDPSGWFEELYAGARAGRGDLPWARGAPRPPLERWAREHDVQGAGRRALVVGAGLGDDAEFVAGLGFDTVAFDFAPTAVAMVRERFPSSPVEYVVADLLDPPAEWSRAFDLVVESLTVQSLPPAMHPAASERVGEFVAPGGTLLVVSVARRDDEEVDGPPWPLTRAEIEAFTADRLELRRLDELPDHDGRAMRWWRAELVRAHAGQG
jgi:hypothetical protein